MTAAESLKAARELLATPEQWVKDSLATDEKGHWIPFNDPEACKFCVDGAIARVMGNYLGGDPFVWYAIDMAAQQLDLGETSVNANDAPETTHADIMRMFDRAIEIAEGR